MRDFPVRRQASRCTHLGFEARKVRPWHETVLVIEHVYCGAISLIGGTRLDLWSALTNPARQCRDDKTRWGSRGVSRLMERTFATRLTIRKSLGSNPEVVNIPKDERERLEPCRATSQRPPASPKG